MTKASDTGFVSGRKELPASAFCAGRKEIIVESQGKKIKFYASEIGYLAWQHIGVKASAEGKNNIALLVAETITDEEGNKFTYDEVMRLKKEYAAPFFDAVFAVNNLTDVEKKS